MAGYQCTLSEPLLKKAEKELNEKDKWRQRDIQALRDMLKKRPDIKFREDDGFLLRFLRAKKFDYGRAFELLVNYYEVRDLYPDIFDNFIPSALKHVLDDNINTVLQDRDKEGRRVFILRIGKWDPGSYSLIDIVRTNFLLLEQLLEEEETQINGIVVINDLLDLTLSHVTQFGPSVAKKMLSIFQNAMPIRLKGIHYMNEPAIFDGIFSLMKPFLQEKTKKRIQFHGDDFTKLHKCIPSAILPSELGGATGPFDNTKLKETLLASEQTFIKNGKFGVIIKSGDELKTDIGGSDPSTGLAGSFKKLTTD